MLKKLKSSLFHRTFRIQILTGRAFQYLHIELPEESSTSLYIYLLLRNNFLAISRNYAVFIIAEA
jgi:hypothetical protein